MRSIETVLALVALATVVATFARRLSVPAPSLLVVAGVIAGLLPGVPTIEVSPELVSLVVLPPLLFAAGEELPLRDLRAVWKPVTALAIGLVLVSAVAVGAVAIALTPMPIGMAFVLGAVLASTDPVAVTALARRLSLPPRVQALVQAESLFNDATSLLLFRVALSLVLAGGAASWGHTLTEFAVLAGGGVLVGALTALGAYLIRRRTEDPVLETVVSLITPYGGYVLAESVHASGVTAVVVASVILGTQATRMTTAPIRIQLTAVFDTVVFILESVVFGLIGLQLPALVRQLTGSHAQWPLYALAIAATLIVVRLLWVFPLSAIAQRHSGATRPSWRVPAVVSWAGARGVVPLAAALSIPHVLSDGSPLPHRDLVLLLTTAVIVITLVVQGFTLAPLVKKAGIALRAGDIRQEQTAARLQLAQRGLAHVEQLAETESAPDFAVDHLRRSWQARIERIQADSDDLADESAGNAYLQLRHEILTVESAELNRLYESGDISDTTRRRIQRTLDLEQAGLTDDD
ncbi:Na+/H+ antiporter [Kibdelosporangium philippinense]|uniref:Na+/H+ antiporter n=1 Tax=Kibdelosporangium philippinense TaxID=211113 RepID=A0ABS8ZCJ6_9PSEU|nr:Na+/H+ antiporter [Kibdelosporangium philippinense]MCE7004570.1 Na+/H+ antiporter [Kibdelosporangium philippinense]